MKSISKVVLFGIVALGGFFLLIQLVPYGRNHTNLPVVDEPNWPSQEVRALAERACFDCHSHETEWPWYTNIAPMSWMIQRDVEEGREHLNFSNWIQGEQHVDEVREVVGEGEMPPFNYLPLHPEARLTDAEKEILIEGLSGLQGGGEHEDDD